MFVYLIILLFTIVWLFYKKFNNAYKYWNRRGIKTPKPELFFGNMKGVIMRSEAFYSLLENIYNEFPDEKVVGFYIGATPNLLIRDPDIIKRIIVQDFEYFTDRGFVVDGDTFANNMFTADYQDWKVMKRKLTPLYSTAKLKEMVPIANHTVKEYMIYLKKLIKKGEPMDVKKLKLNYTVRLISAIGFSLDVNTFDEENNEFVEVIKAIFEDLGLYAHGLLLDGIFPGILKKLPFYMIRRKIANFFKQVLNKTCQREGSARSHKDFMELLSDFYKQKTDINSEAKSDSLGNKDDVIVALTVMLYSGSTETSAITMSFMLYELAKYPDIQNRCYEEIQDVMTKYKQELSYEALKELEYLNMAYDETLRVYAVGIEILRRCVKDYYIPEVKLTVKKGIKLHVSLRGLQTDNKYFEDPERFDPERFAADKKANIHSGTYTPFGDGPRICLGLRYAKMQSILVLAHFLFRFRVTPSERTPEKIRFDPKSFLPKSLDGIFLNLEERNN